MMLVKVYQLHFNLLADLQGHNRVASGLGRQENQPQPRRTHPEPAQRRL